MSYFEKSSEQINLPSYQNGTLGLRRAQLGAIYSIAAFYTLPQKEPAIIVLPTGTGKTAVIFLSAYILKTQRALIVTPSRLVRSQIAQNAETMDVLKKHGVLPVISDCPKVFEVKNRISTNEDWLALKNYDLVVATPHCVSPGTDGVAPPPMDMFDLILMDEAHHSEAPRWTDILKYFEHTKRLLFTATPFRRDKKEVRGKLIYNFPLREAHRDKVFGNIRFIPVSPAASINHDTAIARQTETVYNEDAAAGLMHRVMIRTDSKTRADELKKIYQIETKLRLAVVHSGLSYTTTQKTLEQLGLGMLDGIICVAMLGEGFDFPQLKIAAIHSPHKSLAVTLQFIGRFARTNAEKIGEAKFIAIPQDVRAETDELYRESAAWQDIVSNLSAARVEQEVRIKEIAGSFVQSGLPDFEVADVPLVDFKPFFHAKVYKLEDDPDLTQIPKFPEGISVLRQEFSDEHKALLLLVRQTTHPRWTELDQFSRIEYDFISIFYDSDSKLLFINSTRRTIEFYNIFEEYYGKGAAKLLSGPRINRVLADLQNTEFFSVGLKNGVQNSNSESYLIKSGPSAQKAITPTDGLRYQRGHVMGKGVNADGKSVTIGYSSSSKIWSNTSDRVGALIMWCQMLAKKITTGGNVTTGTELDILDAGKEISSLPIGVVGVGWNEKVYKEFPHARISGELIEAQLLDCDIRLVNPTKDAKFWEIEISYPLLGNPVAIQFSIGATGFSFQWSDPSGPNISVIRDDEETSLIDYLRHYPMSFFLEDFSRLDGHTYFINNSALGASLQPRQITHLDWQGNSIDITREVNAGGLNLINPTSIQDLTGRHLINSAAEVVFFDHGTGEMADFIGFSPTAESIKISLYHCKGSGGPTPGDRVDDAYEVCGQVVKCLLWLKNKQRIRSQIQQRNQTQPSSIFIKGDLLRLQNILGDHQSVKITFEICVVQPGFSAKNISPKIAHILASASDYVRRASSGELILICSP